MDNDCTEHSGPLDEFVAAARAGDLDLAAPAGDSDALIAVRAAEDPVLFVAAHGGRTAAGSIIIGIFVIPVAVTDAFSAGTAPGAAQFAQDLFFQLKIACVLIVTLLRVFGKHAEITDQQKYPDKPVKN